MKPSIHPAYIPSRVHCACGNSWETRSTTAELHLDICSACHPFFTGKQKLMDTQGRIERFNKKYGTQTLVEKKIESDAKAAAEKAAAPAAAPKAPKAPKAEKPPKAEKAEGEKAAKADGAEKAPKADGAEKAPKADKKPKAPKAEA